MAEKDNENRIVSGGLNDMYKTMFRNQRENILATGGAVAGGALGRAIGEAPLWSKQDLMQPRPRAIPKEQLLALRSQVLNNMMDYSSSMAKTNAGLWESAQKQSSASGALVDLLQTFMTAEGGANKALIEQQMESITRLTEDMGQAFEKTFSATGAASSAARGLWARLRQELMGPDAEGYINSPGRMARIATQIADPSLSPQDQSLLLEWLSYEYKNRFGKDLLAEMRAIADRDGNAANILNLAETLGPQLQMAKEEFLNARGRLIQGALRDLNALATGGGVNLQRVKEAANVFGGVLAGESTNLLEGEKQLAGMEAEEEKPSPLQEGEKLLEELASTEEISPTKRGIMQSKEYQQTVDAINESFGGEDPNWVPLQYEDNQTFRLVNFIRKKENRERREAVRGQIRQMKFGGSKEAPSAGAQMAGGAGESELGTGADAPTDVAEEMPIAPGSKTTFSDVNRTISKGAQAIADQSLDLTPETYDDRIPGIWEQDGKKVLGMWNPETSAWDADSDTAKQAAAAMKAMAARDPAKAKAKAREYHQNWRARTSAAAVQSRIDEENKAAGEGIKNTLNSRKDRILELVRQNQTFRNRQRRRERADARDAGDRS